MAALRSPEKQSARGLETAPKACIGVPCTAQTPASSGFGACLTLLIAISLEQASDRTYNWKPMQTQSHAWTLVALELQDSSGCAIL